MAKKNRKADAVPLERDEVLFVALGRNKKRRRRKIIITVVSVLLIVAAAAAVGIGILRQKVQEQFAASSGEVLSHTVTTGSISTTVSGSGSLTDVEQESVTVPDGVEITQVLVQTNDPVEEGDVLATVEMTSVISAMAELQTRIQELDEQLSEAEEDEAEDVIYAGVSGRVKAIFAEAGTAVTDAMFEHGALALLSLDGYMAVDVKTDVLLTGESVTVKLSDDETVDGTVEAVTGDTATILIPDNGPEYGDKVTVCDSDGQRIGSGELYIHSPLRITGYAGTVDTVKTSLNKKVTDTTKLFVLEDTAYSANYSSLLRSRGALEETLLELLQIKHSGAVLSPVSGSVYSVDHTEGSTSVATLSADEKMSVTISVDESDILALELGQQVEVTVSSVSEETFAGTLTEINRTGASSGSYSAVIELEKTEGMLSGMTAQVSVRIEGVDDALLIPVEALHKTRDGAYVYTSYDEQLQEYGGKVDVTTGLENSTYVQIKSGLSIGDTVYYTEQESGFGNMGFGNMPGGNSGGFPGSSERTDSGGERPDFGGSGGQRPGSNMPGSRG